MTYTPMSFRAERAARSRGIWPLGAQTHPCSDGFVNRLTRRTRRLNAERAEDEARPWRDDRLHADPKVLPFGVVDGEGRCAGARSSTRIARADSSTRCARSE